jgi:hypothetical protein
MTNWYRLGSRSAEYRSIINAAVEGARPLLSFTKLSWNHCHLQKSNYTLIVNIAYTILAFSAAVSVQQQALAATPSCTLDGFDSLRPLLSDPARPPAEARTVTTFLSGGSEGEVVFRYKPADAKGGLVRIFETNGTDIKTFKDKAEPFVVSTKPTPEKLVTGFDSNNSILIQFVAPDHDFPLWHTRTFVILDCAGDGSISAWGLVRAPVSNRPIVVTISVVFLAALYGLFALAVSAIRNRNHPLAVKYPAYRSPRRFSFWEYLDPVRLTADIFNHASVQKLQILLFTILVAGMLLMLALSVGRLSELSGTLLGLLGISGVGAAASQATSTNRNRLTFENWAWLVRRGLLPINQEYSNSPTWGDLVLTGREFDVYKLQTIIFTLVVAAALLVGGEERLASFSVPETLLGILGLSQVVYLGGILVRPRSIGDLDDAITELRNREGILQTAVAHNTDTTADGKLPDPLPPADTTSPLAERKAKAVNASRRYDEQANQVALMLESTLEVTADRAKLDPTLT